MTTPIRMGIAAPAVVLSLSLGAGAAFAQAKRPSQGPLVLEPTASGPVFAPEVKVGDFDGRSGIMVGAYGGWLIDDRLLVGAGGTVLVDHDERDAVGSMGYAGFVAGWTFPVAKAFQVGVKGLVGAGSATFHGASDWVVPVPWHQPGWPSEWPDRRPARPWFSFSDEFFIFEPQATALLRVARGFAIDVSAGYRAVAGAGSFNRELRGASAGVALRLGPKF